MIRRFRRCGHAPGAISPEDQAVVDQFRAMLTAVRNPEPWTPGSPWTSPCGSARSSNAPTPGPATTTAPR
ncbi:hypothetical protein [Streptomyces daghestanicus]|uniref:Uncharacterized protein n=1 Tax=Streptomyces daghestanicus TaxID=66885 RepID=A0ABQ3Q7I3_9ACTN|nr:hypothetical protein [Streptomyces daghestanicus]GHI33200.1 hypothetical protein Sdagh_49300 [Streptomyces daghestanicus]